VSDSLNRAPSSTLDVAISAGEQISDLLTQLQSTALNATDPSLTSTNRQSLARSACSMAANPAGAASGGARRGRVRA